MSLRKLYDLMVPENDGAEEYAPLRLGWCTGALMGPAREVTLVWRSDGIYMDNCPSKCQCNGSSTQFLLAPFSGYIPDGPVWNFKTALLPVPVSPYFGLTEDQRNSLWTLACGASELLGFLSKVRAYSFFNVGLTKYRLLPKIVGKTLAKMKTYVTAYSYTEVKKILDAWDPELAKHTAEEPAKRRRAQRQERIKNLSETLEALQREEQEDSNGL